MALITIPFTIVNGTANDATEVMANFNTVYNAVNGNLNYENLASSGVRYSNLYSDITERISPIGTIIPFYDYNGALSFDTNYWAYCDGSTKTIAGIGSQTLPDLSGRYLVGFGTDGGGDIGTDPWAVVAVGNSGHIINIEHNHANTASTSIANESSHTHTGPSHTHTGPSHTHTGPSHTHGPGTLQFPVLELDSTYVYSYNVSGNKVAILRQIQQSPGSGDNTLEKYGASNTYYTDLNSGAGATASGGTGATGSGGTGATGAGGTGATSAGSTHNHSATTIMSNPVALSTVQSIQPRSVRVRYIMRIA